MPPVNVEEMQGLYGPFSLTERVVQGIWARGDYYSGDLKTASGRALRVVDPGKWNLLEGPDFKEAHLQLDGEDLHGDVEVHFKPEDWWAHGHEKNSNFDRVILHVVLQEGHGDAGEPVKTSRGHVPELLVLLPLLERDLEAYALDEALIDLERVNELAWVETFLERPLSEREELLSRAAGSRWQQKSAFARKRLAGSDWRSACHQLALEVLGYARNRAPMHRIALEHPIEDFATRPALDEFYASQEGKWKLQGLRPANHPKKRLLQYAAICAQNPDWPERLSSILMDQTGQPERSTRDFRRVAGLKALREAIAVEVFGGHLGGTRLDTLLCDAIFPLAAAGGIKTAASLWSHWFPGDMPTKLGDFLKLSGLSSVEEPKSNGRFQGALGLFLSEGEV